ncbi:hypothetical protein A3C86_01370 [Candidatus Kaiserbacteria bacterium RIFCSPHIGHO2_02_FULL_49_16]|uniref:Uncharacterized protein n=2 Tax=Parcubacteria group TaxID=1794811 RepID=A0A0G1WEN8_9BACT|nr:MAG: hypothetical protein UY58_C0007G0013 [Candidatus Magasanikbacteria bacterium GW2011_GWA2_50_22]OGG59017.1 MAG: hypothetical protein A3C86_01370 [Candidatus Kaiserbacteria bacterium RIFCSPHIGHO2_02_FULL_49_16]
MNVRPESFDILGLIAFPSIALLSLYALITGNTLPRWALFLLLFIGIAGLIIDGVIVYKTFLKKQ